MCGHTNGDGIQSAGHQVRYFRTLWKNQREWTRPKGIHQFLRSLGQLLRDTHDMIAFGDVYDERVETGPLLDREDLQNGTFIEGIRSQTVHCFRRDGNDLSGPQQRRRMFNIATDPRRSWVQMSASYRKFRHSIGADPSRHDILPCLCHDTVPIDRSASTVRSNAFHPEPRTIGTGSAYVLVYQICFIMPRAKKKLILTQPIKEGLKAIKVRLDHRTVITLASLKALEFWKKRYPQAQVIG